MTLTTKQVSGKAAILAREKKDKGRRIGKVRRSVFHPTEKRLIGFIIKRPDVAWMFHRGDLFVALDSVRLQDEGLIITDEPQAQGSRALKRLGVDWESCLLWEGMELVTEDGESLGTVGNVAFDETSGQVEHLEVNQGATARALLGVTRLEPSMIKGFRWGARVPALDARSETPHEGGEASFDDHPAPALAKQKKPEEAEWVGVIIISDEALQVESEGGIADAAGRATATAIHKGKEAASTLKESVSAGMEKAKPTMDKAAKKTEELVNKGAFLAGRQIGRSTNMFSDFMKEYRKAAHGDDDDES